MFECRVCHNHRHNRAIVVREMMFGWRDCFDYFECGKCGCLQIYRVPDDLARYYPNDYYSYVVHRDSVLKSWLKQRWHQQHQGQPNGIGWVLTKLKGAPWYPESLHRVALKRESAVLDIGCGTGGLLLQLRDAGFRDLTGVDPYIERDLHYRGGVTVFNGPLSALAGTYDFVMLHHSFEHMSDPYQVLKETHRLLKPTGCVLIRTPVAQSYAWEKFHAHWVQIDAPRHLLVHSEASLRLVARSAGFEVTDVVYDSTEFQFWGSIQYQQDIPLRSARSYALHPRRSIFTMDEIRTFMDRAKALNAAGRGDQACFHLAKANTETSGKRHT